MFMKKREIKIEFSEYDKSSELDKLDAELVEFAKEAVKSSYSPYSKFAVGAAVRLANGVVIKGSNQENGAYPSGLCAERVALFAAGSQYPDVAIEAIAITVNTKSNYHKGPLSPCGACCQVMLESETRSKSDMKIIMHGENDTCYVADNVRSVLPFAFDSDFLK